MPAPDSRLEDTCCLARGVVEQGHTLLGFCMAFAVPMLAWRAWPGGASFWPFGALVTVVVLAFLVWIGTRMALVRGVSVPGAAR